MRGFNWGVLVTFVGLLGCSGLPPATTSTTQAVVVQEWSSPVLYYSVDTAVFRSVCPRETRLYNPQTCTGETRLVLAKTFYSEGAKKFGEELPLVEEQIRQSYIKIAQTDDFLLQYVTIDPQVPATGALRRQLDDLQVEIARKELFLTELKSQQAQLRAALASHDTPNNRLQLAEIERQIQVTNGEFSTLMSTLATTRQQYIETHTNVLDQDTYDALIRQRDSHLNELSSLKHDYDSELQDAANLAKMCKRLELSGIAFEYMEQTAANSDTWYVANSFGDIFQAAWVVEHPTP